MTMDPDVALRPPRLLHSITFEADAPGFVVPLSVTGFVRVETFSDLHAWAADLVTVPFLARVAGVRGLPVTDSWHLADWTEIRFFTPPAVEEGDPAWHVHRFCHPTALTIDRLGADEGVLLRGWADRGTDGRLYEFETRPRDVS